MVSIDAKTMASIVGQFAFVDKNPIHLVFSGGEIRFEGTDGMRRLRRTIAIIGGPLVEERIAVDFKLLSKTVKALAGELSLIIENGVCLKVKGKNDSQYKLTSVDAEPIAFTKPQGTFPIRALLFRRGLEKTLPFVDSASSLRVSLTGIQIIGSEGKLTFNGSNGHLLSRYECITEVLTNEFTIILPQEAARLILSIKAETFDVLMIENRGIVLVFEDGIFESAIIEEPFPEVNTLLVTYNAGAQNKIVTLIEKWREALGIVSLYSSHNSKAVDIYVSKDKVELRAEDEDFGGFAKQWYHEESIAPEPSVLVRISGPYLSSVLSVIDTDKMVVRFTEQGKNSPVIFAPSDEVDENLIVLAMPMRIEQYEKEYAEAFASESEAVLA